MAGRWLFLASDYAACIRDTRGLAIDHGLIWFGSASIAPPEQGDGLLLGFKLSRKRLFVPLATFFVQECEQRQLALARRNCSTVADLPEELRDAFQRATRGQSERGEGTGYNTRGRSKNPVLCVEKVETFAKDWAGVDGPHSAPAGLTFGLADRVDEGNYLLPFTKELLSDPLLPERFHPPERR